VLKFGKLIAEHVGKPESDERRNLVRVLVAYTRPLLTHIPQYKVKPSRAINVAHNWADGLATIEYVRVAADDLSRSLQAIRDNCGYLGYGVAFAAYATVAAVFGDANEVVENAKLVVDRTGPLLSIDRLVGSLYTYPLECEPSFNACKEQHATRPTSHGFKFVLG
jgi:hypothetical protein